MSAPSQGLRLTCVILFPLQIFAADPVIIAQGSGKQAPKQPQAVVSDEGAAHVVYGVGDTLFYVTFTDGNKTLSKTKLIASVANLSLGMRRGPRIAVVGKSLVVTAIGGEQGGGRDGDLLSWRSVDGGDTWTGPVTVNDVAAAAREGLHGMAAGPDGAVWCVWLDLRDKKTQVYLSKSTDGGASWGANVKVYQSPSGSVCECCHPSVAVSSAGVHVMFRNSIDGNRDMYFCVSKDGQDFGPAKKLGDGTWKLNACPMDGGMLALGKNGTIYSAWRRKGDVFATDGAGKKEGILGKGEQPWITVSNDVPIVCWTEGRDGALWLKKSTAQKATKLDETAHDPVVATAIGGDGPTIVCWESKRDGKSLIVATLLEGSDSQAP